MREFEHLIPPLMDTEDPEFWRGYEAGTVWACLTSMPVGVPLHVAIATANRNNLESMVDQLDDLTIEWMEPVEDLWGFVVAHVTRIR